MLAGDKNMECDQGVTGYELCQSISTQCSSQRQKNIACAHDLSYEHRKPNQLLYQLMGGRKKSAVRVFTHALE
jgi:hypothetical protein